MGSITPVRFATLVRSAFVVLLAVVLLAGPVAAPAAAQSESGVGGTITVEAGETVDEVSALAGNVVVRGTVTGDVSAAAGNVHVEDGGEVRGDVDALAGNVEIAGAVGGDVSAAGGNVVVTESGAVEGTLDAAAGTVRVDGAVDGDARVGAETIVLGDEAQLGGDLTYAGTLEGNEGAVAGEVVEETAVGVDLAPTVQPLASWLFAAYALAMNLLLGAILLALFPRFSREVADRVASTPVRTGLVGLGVLVGVPILLVAIAITVIGIPISVLGAFAFAFVIWVGIVYGRFAVAAWLLSYANVGSPWLALVVGLVAGALLSQVPFVGSPLNLLVFLLGLGGLATALVGRRRRVPADRTPTGPAAD